MGKNNNENFKQLEIPVVKMAYELYKYTHKIILGFPKHERYTLGEKLENHLLEIIELIIFGNCQPKNFKEDFLAKANSKAELLKIMYRLAFDTDTINQKVYLKTEEYLQEIGKMLGGWIKYLRSG